MRAPEARGDWLGVRDWRSEGAVGSDWEDGAMVGPLSSKGPQMVTPLSGDLANILHWLSDNCRKEDKMMKWSIDQLARNREFGTHMT